MPRPLRLEYAGAICHVTARGTRQGAIFLDDRDRETLLTVLTRTLKACDARMFAYCLMGNHYHFVLQTRQANLAVLMRRVNGLYSPMFNRCHGRSGHVFEGRFKALHVDRDGYLLEVCRYVDLNPVRAGLVESPAHWNWSSYRAHTGVVAPPPWLATHELHGALAGGPSDRVVDGASASRRYADWVEAGRDVPLWQRALRKGRYLGGEAFVERMEQLQR